MKLSLLMIVLALPVAVAFHSTSPYGLVPRMAGHLSMSSMPTVSQKEKPERVIPDTLPTLYVYDHCPFCVRVRLAFGLKNVKHNLYFLANDDAATPTKLVGKKIAPILQWEDLVMPESLDIINYIDQTSRCGPMNSIAPATGRTDLKEWQSGVRDLLRNLQRPRYVATGLLPEFQQLDARQAFIKNHQLPGYSKDDWKAKPLSEQLVEYADLMARDPTNEVAELNRQLIALDNLVYSSEYCSESAGGVSLDDIDLFARLRSITIVKGVQWPAKLRAYMEHFSEMGDIPLYDEMAL